MGLSDRLIELNGTSNGLGLFYASRLGNCVHIHILDVVVS